MPDDQDGPASPETNLGFSGHAFDRSERRISGIDKLLKLSFYVSRTHITCYGCSVLPSFRAASSSAEHTRLHVAIMVGSLSSGVLPFRMVQYGHTKVVLFDLFPV